MLRPPIIAVLGHVDHGKTTLLDALRRTSLAAAEPGGITQTIGAFRVAQQSTINNQQSTVNYFTFIDTPGHEAFSKMRSRGAAIADIALLVVAADDGVKLQTLESLAIIKSAQIPFIVVINKIDLDEANPTQVKTELTKHDAAVEGFGGNVPVVEISAKTGKNLPELLEMISLVWDFHPNSQNSLDPQMSLEAPVIDSRLDPHSGPIASVIVRRGILRLGDKITTGESVGKVKSLTGDRGQHINEAFPGDPVQVLGLKSVPPIGSIITHLPKTTSNGQQTKNNVTTRSLLPTPDSKPVILKSDSVATLETLEDSIISLPKSKFFVVASGIGDIIESDILLAASSKSDIIGFRIKVSKKKQQLAKNEGVLIITDNIIYNLLRQLTDLQKPEEEKLPPEAGRAKIIKVFTIDGASIAGCIIESGKLEVGNSVFLVKDNIRIGPTRIKQLKSRANVIKEAKPGTQCGILLETETEGQKLKLSEGQDIIAYQI